jgi:hypothetical protein
MVIFQSGHISSLIFLIIFITATMYFSWLGKRGKYWSIRKITAIDAISEQIGRAVEMDKPVYWSPGDEADLVGTYAQEVIASLAILSYVAELCAKNGAKLIVSIGGKSGKASEIYPIVEEIVRSAYLMEGKPEEFKSENVRYVADRIPWAFSTIGWMYREGAAAGIWIGPWAGSYLPVAGTAARLGAIQIGGTARILPHIPIMACVFDYLIIGEEIFAAGAQISKDPITISYIAVHDLGKYIGVALIIIGTILLSLGSSIIKELLVF